jgi:hypothetical protein
MTTSSISTRIALTTVLATGLFTAPAFAAATTVHDASAALSFWIAWGLVYLGAGVVLLAVAVAIGVGEGRAWSSLLRWTADESAADDEPETRSRDAA